MTYDGMTIDTTEPNTPLFATGPIPVEGVCDDEQVAILDCPDDWSSPLSAIQQKWPETWGRCSC